MKLTEQLSFFKLNNNKMKHIKGGTECGCACYYADTGGSSIDDNCDKNHEKGLWSPIGNIKCLNVAEL